MKIKPYIISLGYVGLPVILNLSKKFESEYKKLNIKENKTKLLDPFEYYKRKFNESCLHKQYFF